MEGAVNSNAAGRRYPVVKLANALRLIFYIRLSLISGCTDSKMHIEISDSIRKESRMETCCLTLQYDGARYKGWQKQGNTPDTIQEKLEALLSRLYDAPVEISGSGRTDAGVHALGQTASFHVPASGKQYSCSELCALMNQYLPQDIRVLSAEEKGERFHARLLAKSKIYEYHIDNGPSADVFRRRYALHIAESLDLAAMEKAASCLIGTHDFKSFCANSHMKKSSVRTIYQIDLIPDGQFLTIRYCGNGFLYNMVRIMTGTLIETGLHQKSPEDISGILAACDRSLAGFTAPPHGLFLVRVSYGE